VSPWIVLALIPVLWGLLAAYGHWRRPRFRPLIGMDWGTETPALTYFLVYRNRIEMDICRSFALPPRLVDNSNPFRGLLIDHSAAD
jgi:hypothetical protein